MPTARSLHVLREKALGQAADQVRDAEDALSTARGNLDLLIRDSVQAQGYQVAAVARAARVSRETVYAATRRIHTNAQANQATAHRSATPPAEAAA
jgi:hypothetical protein